MLDRLAKRFPIRRVVLVADRGLLNLDNLAALDAVKLPSGEALEYIIAVPGVRYGDFDEYSLSAGVSCGIYRCARCVYR